MTSLWMDTVALPETHEWQDGAHHDVVVVGAGLSGLGVPYALDILRVTALGTIPIAPVPLLWLGLLATSLLSIWIGVVAFRATERRLGNPLCGDLS